MATEVIITQPENQNIKAMLMSWLSLLTFTLLAHFLAAPYVWGGYDDLGLSFWQALVGVWVLRGIFSHEDAYLIWLKMR